MRFLFAIIVALLFNSNAWPQRSLSPLAFQSNVRPVITGIIGDFYQMISLFPDFPKEIISVVELVDGLSVAKANLQEKCPKTLNASCQTNVQVLSQKLSTISAKGLELLSTQRVSASLHINTLAGLRITSDFFMAVEELKGDLANASLKIKAGVPFIEPTHYVIKRLDQLSTFISLAVVEYVPYSYKDDFRHFFFNFIHPVQQHIGKNKNYEFLNRNVNTLNFTLNLLIQNLTKRNKKTPEGMAPYLNVIHNRWNGLLRYYF